MTHRLGQPLNGVGVVGGRPGCHDISRSRHCPCPCTGLAEVERLVEVYVNLYSGGARLHGNDDADCDRENNPHRRQCCNLHSGGRPARRAARAHASPLAVTSPTTCGDGQPVQYGVLWHMTRYARCQRSAGGADAHHSFSRQASSVVCLSRRCVPACGPRVRAGRGAGRRRRHSRHSRRLHLLLPPPWSTAIVRSPNCGRVSSDARPQYALPAAQAVREHDRLRRSVRSGSGAPRRGRNGRGHRRPQRVRDPVGRCRRARGRNARAEIRHCSVAAADRSGRRARAAHAGTPRMEHGGKRRRDDRVRRAALGAPSRSSRACRPDSGGVEQQLQKLSNENIELVRASKAPEIVLGAITFVAGLLGLFFTYSWLTFVLRRFPYTRPWGESLREFLLSKLAAMALAIVTSIPDLFTVFVIVLVTRSISRLVYLMFEAAERGRMMLPGVHPEIAQPTRRLAHLSALAVCPGRVVSLSARQRL